MSKAGARLVSKAGEQGWSKAGARLVSKAGAGSGTGKDVSFSDPWSGSRAGGQWRQPRLSPDGRGRLLMTKGPRMAKVRGDHEPGLAAKVAP